jgi:hypothetical protein
MNEHETPQSYENLKEQFLAVQFAIQAISRQIADLESSRSAHEAHGHFLIAQIYARGGSL